MYVYIIARCTRTYTCNIRVNARVIYACIIGGRVNGRSEDWGRSGADGLLLVRAYYETPIQNAGATRGVGTIGAVSSSCPGRSALPELETT
jgi:hypothetical protein